MNLEEAKKLFEANHKEETENIKSGDERDKRFAGCVWYGFKSALKITGKLTE